MWSSEWIEGVEILIEAGADMKIRDDDGESLLHIAAVVSSLIKHSYYSTTSICVSKYHIADIVLFVYL